MILTKLKEATKTRHQSLETKVDLMNQIQDLSSYEKLLRSFYGFYMPVEPQIFKLFQEKEIEFDYTERLKVSLLENDLKILNGGDFEIGKLEICKNLPEINSFAQSLGSMYVLEGATLGGQIIGRHLRDNLGLTAENGASFFNSYGGNVGTMWKDFGIMATKQAEILNDDEVITAAAQSTFTKFEEWLNLSLSHN
jgi:heme oxygenase (biliverdin-IX-beta and delta-forming)